VRRVELYFETYLIIALLFAIITVCIAGLFLKNKKYTLLLSALVIFLGFFIPYLLIIFQKVYGSLNEHLEIMVPEQIDINNITPEDLKNMWQIDRLDRPNFQVAFDYFTHNLGFIVLSITIGIALGILIYLLLKKQKWIA
jgi:hypothetical protein